VSAWGLDGRSTCSEGWVADVRIRPASLCGMLTCVIKLSREMLNAFLAWQSGKQNWLVWRKHHNAL
jgi:hypothetical protein